MSLNLKTYQEETENKIINSLKENQTETQPQKSDPEQSVKALSCACPQLCLSPPQPWGEAPPSVSCQLLAAP